MAEAFLLDTCVISETSLPFPRAEVVRFINEADNLLLPAGALMELQMGITILCSTNPIKAVQLSNWYYALMRSGIPMIVTDRDVIETWGILAADKRLRNLFVPRMDGRFHKYRAGQDLHIAAASIAHRLPIATFNVRDFMLIHDCYPLPGIYDPSTSTWHARMGGLRPFEET